LLFGYPVTATEENWLHNCLCEMVIHIHASIEADKEPLPWPDNIPAAHRNRLRSRTGLRDRLQKYRDAATAKGMTSRDRERVLVCLSQQNDIKGLTACVTDCEYLAALPEALRGPIEELFGFAFGLLTDFGVRDRQYKIIHDALSHDVCPFCGCEFLDAPGGPREDLDHFLAKSLYPFASANLQNLVPMGMKCNERYKHAQDILRDDGGVRRRCFYPYEDHHITVSLVKSVPFAGTDDEKPAWQIDFEPESVECTTWDTVFHVRERFRRDVLDASFSTWMGDFARWFVKRKGNADTSNARITESVLEHAEDMAIQGLKAKEFLRAYVFEMLHEHCQQGNARLLAFMRDLVANAVPQ